ncbi:MAG: YncE family protein [Dehalococcoidia bacterium]|nr:MAG: YncE family protein [Dehalococcoidia bacterium]
MLAFALTLLTLSVLVPYVIASVGPLQIVATITLDKEPECIAVNEETNRVYVGVEDGLLVIDCDSYDVVAVITLEAEVIGLTINPQTNSIYAVVYGENVSVIDGATNQVVSELPETIHDSAPGVGIAVNPVTNLVYIEDRTATMGYYDRVDVYSGETNSLVTSLNITESSTHSYIEELGLAVNPKINRIYVTWSGDNTLHMFDGNTHEFMESVSPSSFSEELMVNPYTNYVYVGDVVLDGETLGEVTSDYQGDLKAIDPVNNLLYTTDYRTLYVLDGTTHDVLTSLEVDWGVSSYSDPVAVNCETGKVYVVDTSENQIPVVIPEFPTWTSMLLVLFALAVAIFIYRRRPFKTPIHQQSSAL